MSDQVAEYTPVFRPCRHCGVDVEQPRRKGATKEFCRDAHRAAFRNADLQRTIAAAAVLARDAERAIDQAIGELAQVGAQFNGLAIRLERFKQKSARTKKSIASGSD